jgi:mannose-6-phosphate isomerase-like protein (cupin superfamily)
MSQPILSADLKQRDRAARFIGTGQSFALREWRGSGPAKLHVHHADDEAWHVLDGVLRFRFADREVQVGAGETVFVPAGVAHTYDAVEARYLIVLTPRLVALIDELQAKPPSEHAAVYRKHLSELLE